MAKKRKAAPTHHNPFRGFIDVMSEMNRAQSQWLQRSDSESGQGARSIAGAYVPSADIFADDNDLIVRCEVPGVRREDVSVTVSKGVLTISGYRASELDEEAIVYYARERVYGSFRRSMILPEGVEDSDVKAIVRNGLLEIRVINGASGKTRNIDIVDKNED